MRRLVLIGFLFANASVFAQTENSDVFALGGGLHGLNHTTWTYEVGFIYEPATHFGIGLAYNNEGHLPDNHRDGLAAQAWYVQSLSRDFEVQLGTGPYLSMNNTTVDGVRENDFEVGLLTSAALKWHPAASPWYLRAQYNNAWVPRSFNSKAVLLGLGRDFSFTDDPNNSKLLDADVSVWLGSSRTTQIGTQETAIGYEVEAKFRARETFSYSVAFLSEGDTNLVNRRGVVAQVWLGADLSERLAVSGGIGPYLAYDGDHAGKVGVLGIASARVTLVLLKTQQHRYEAGLMYTRVASFYNRDQDIFMIGLLAQL